MEYLLELPPQVLSVDTLQILAYFLKYIASLTSLFGVVRDSKYIYKFMRSEVFGIPDAFMSS